MIAGFFPFTCSGRFVSGIILMVVAFVNLTIALPWYWLLILFANIIISMDDLEEMAQRILMISGGKIEMQIIVEKLVALCYNDDG